MAALRQNLLHVYFNNQYFAAPIPPSPSAPISCWPPMMRIIPRNERCSHDRQRLAEWRPLGVGPLRTP
ncbi:hypothetical protein HBI56_118260 [Parastagonospora nodorum]|uniref:Uncharacterized protein n=1 Tax=Phaeosphaeria nodorum (strain SN15 / ATCC MYA-4574 / FGSC 10173) TaxID=321614 RepID=A0A7U2FC07_PHANO|nr:hypothetical protein HBH56_056510 [Parastagonospora nodorum]QRD02483.1 hypothetical protein JI435_418100 [Parastagonospora nodorum SN15]KAH3921094.1 hypothetical protein HBH54_245740 [Parastagonospora nodorum]KAH3948457.1 hypothetical protein HBH53_097010 [Parastagonospora nodorum]KAH3956415.1 hypothetical protein HBH51_242140 [Parastagonospora nodorum]